MLFSAIKRIGVAAVLAGLASIATADPIDYLSANTDLQIKFQNREVEITGLNQELFGLVNITSILNVDGTTTFWSGNGVTDGTQLVGYFEGLTSIADQTGGGGLSFTGGSLVIYNVTSGSYSPSTSPDTKDYANQLCGGVCPTPWLTADFVPGINDLFGAGANATLQAAIATTNVQAGFGYASVTGGTNAAFFDSDMFTFTNFAAADLFLRSNFVLGDSNTCPLAQSGGWGVCSDDPITARTVGVSEPGILALLGISGLVVGVVRRRKGSSRTLHREA